MAQVNSPIRTLNAEWQFRRADNFSWMDAIVPGCVHTDLIRNHVIEHPFYGTNETACQWVGEMDWVYETKPFDVHRDLMKNEVVRLRFNGLDTYSDVYLNDVLLVKTNNAFRYWEVDVRKHLHEKNNVIRIEFHSPLPIANEHLKALPYPLPYESVRAVTRKPQFHYGWDWGPRLITCGITKSIEWITYDEARMEDIYIEPLRVTEAIAQLKTRFSIHAVKEGNYTLRFEMIRTGDYWTTTVKLKRGINLVELPFDIEGPYRWWCNGYGKPTLYDFRAELFVGERLIESQTITTGLRDVKLITQKDSIGESFYFTLNDVPIFAKGANMIPLRFFPGEATEEDYRNLLISCKESNINMLRVWGGGVYEDDVFYRLCDEYGIMVWQDFMFACAMYPADSSFVATVIEEANQQTKRLRNHPSLALWCGNNENAEGWERWGWQQGLTNDQKFRIKRAYDDVFVKTLPKIVKENTTLDYWESSPRFGRADKRSFTEGDSHYWGLWHDEEPFEDLVHKVPRFMSEFGMQSFPSMEVVQQMIVGDQLQFDNAGIAQHQKHNRGFKLMDKYMQYWYPKLSTDSLEWYAKITQAVQAEGIGMGIEAQRRAMPRCMGTLYWQLNDVWPSFSWSGMDYLGKPKMLHQYLKTIYAPQLISCWVENNELFIYWISDNLIPDESRWLKFTIRSASGSFAKAAKPVEWSYTSSPTKVKLMQGSHILYRVPLKTILGNRSPMDHLIDVTLEDDHGKIKYQRIQKLVPQSNSFLLIPELDEYFNQTK